MKIDLFALLKGAVDIEIKGRFSERFLNLAFQEGIELSRIERVGDSVFARVSLLRVHDLRAIARRSHCPFRIHGRVGLPFIVAYLKKRPFLPLMAAIAVFSFSYVSSLIFSLGVSGPYPVPQEDQQRVLSLAADVGIEPGHSRWGIDMEEAKQYILSNFKELVFIEIVDTGVHVTINVVKRVNVSADDAIKNPGNLIAGCDGIIEDILVRRGTAAVNPGDAVCKGDILIYGWQGGQAVAADGIVTARLWGEGYGECAYKEEGLELSGKASVAVGIRINNSPLLIIAGTTPCPYEEYQTDEEVARSISWRKTDPLVEVIIRKFSELIPYTTVYTPEEAQENAREEAQENAYNDLANLIDENSKNKLSIIDTKTEDIPLDSDLARAHAVCEGRIKIGIYQTMTENEILN